jgi:hypothetical protein
LLPIFNILALDLRDIAKAAPGKIRLYSAYTMDDGRWPMADGRWPMDDMRWTMDDGRWTIVDMRWTMDDGNRTLHRDDVESPGWGETARLTWSQSEKWDGWL